MVAEPLLVEALTVDQRAPGRDDGAIPLTRIRRRSSSTTFRPQPGDLVFGNRLSWTQVAKNVSADQWTHVAIVVELDRELSVIELGPKGCVTRSLTDFSTAYRFVGFARPAASEPCRDRLASWARSQLGVETYSWLHFAVAGCASMARRFSPSAAEQLVIRASRRAAHIADGRDPGAMVCSSFVWDGLMHVCDACRPRLAWPARDRVVPWRARPTVTDVHDQSTTGAGRGDRAARLLANPSDIWVARRYAMKVVVEGEHATALHDVDSNAPRRCIRLEARRLSAAPRHRATLDHALGA